MSTMWWDLVLKSLVVAGFGLGLTALMRRSSASARHLTLTLTLVGLLALPVGAIFLPRWELPFLRVQAGAAAPAQVSDSRSVAGSVAVSQGQSIPAKGELPIPLILWSAVGGLLLLRTAMRLVRLRGLEKRLPMSNDPVLHSIVTDHCRRSSRHVLLLEGPADEPPMTWGHLRPILLMPGEAGNWQTPRLNSVVLHELAHIERGDWLASLLAQVACAAFWFNPFVWLIVHQMGRESESAADDRVLSHGLSAPEYASDLLGVLKDLRVSRSASNVGLAMARPGSLDGRVRAILEERRCRRPLRGAAAFGLVGTLGVLVMVTAAAGPTLVHADPQSDPIVTFEAVAPHLSKQVKNQPKPARTTPVRPTTPRPHVSSTTPTKKGTTRSTTKKKSLIPSGNSVSIDLSGITTQAMSSAGSEADAGLWEAQAEVEKALSEAQKEIAQANHESGAQTKLAQDAVKFGQSIAKSTLSTLKRGLQGAVLKQGPRPPKKQADKAPPETPKASS